MDAEPRRRRPALQIVVRDVGQIGRYKLRIVRASERPDAPLYLDLRERIENATYSGFTRKGVRLNAAEARALRAMLDEVLIALD